MQFPDYNDETLLLSLAGQVSSTEPSELKARLVLDDLRKVQALRQAFRWSNGVVLVPTFAALARRDALNTPAPEAAVWTALTTLLGAGRDDGRRLFGTLWGGLKLLALQGLIELRGQDESSAFRPTPRGTRAGRLYQQHRPLFDRVPVWAAALSDPLTLRDGRGAAEHLARLSEMAELYGKSWGLRTDDADDLAIVDNMIESLDGLLIGSLLVATDMPEYQAGPAGPRPSGPSPLARLATGEGPLADWVDDRFAAIATRVLALAGILSTDGAALTDWGEWLRRTAAPFSGLGVSYLRSYARIEEILFEDPDPLGIDNDRHIDRVVNIYASSGAGSGPLSQTLLREIVRPIFDEPLEQQPAGIADMGCGDGSGVLRMARYIIENTERGRHLDRYPLTVIGADYNESARSVASKTLSALDDVSGVAWRVLHADISEPSAYNSTIREQRLPCALAGGDGTVGAADLVHSFMFLLHNRRLHVCDEREAAEIFRKGGSDPEVLRDAFGVSFAGSDGLVSGYQAAADLFAMLQRWRPFLGHGMLVLEGHSPSGAADNYDPGDLPHVLNWGMHFPSRQYMMPFSEFLELLGLARFEAANGIHGCVYPEGLEGPDTKMATRFFSIARFVPTAS